MARRTDTPGGSSSGSPGDARPEPAPRRILVIDDNEAIHSDIRNILASHPSPPARLMELENELFGAAVPNRGDIGSFEVDAAFQGKQGLELVQTACQEGRPYSVAFVDIRMPPGWDGIETTLQLWQADPSLQIVLCTAYSDYSWEQLVEQLGEGDRHLILRKPFDVIEVRQMAFALSEKWALLREKRARFQELETIIQERAKDLEEANRQLRSEMDERLLMEKKLRRAQKMQALGRLSAGMSHEINNPLCFVIGNLQLAQDAIESMASELSDQRLEELSTAIRDAMMGSERIDKIVRDVGLYARADRSIPGPVKLHRVLDAAINITGNDIRHRARLVKEYGEIPPVLGEDHRLEQVFVNLLHNSAQAMPVGQALDNEVRITTRAEPTGWAVVEIRDSGQGIAAESLERIFEPFFTTKPVGEGTGLGLSLCHSIITAFGGTLEVDSQEGQGTVVTVRLPIVSRTAAAARSSAKDEDSGELGPLIAPPVVAPPARQPGALRILLVDDEAPILEMLEKVLGNHTVYTAIGGRKALEQYWAHGPDLVLCDLMMPEMSGMELYQELAKEGPDHARRVVFMTGGAFTAEASDFVESTRNRCLQKPFSNRDLMAVIESFLDQ